MRRLRSRVPGALICRAAVACWAAVFGFVALAPSAGAGVLVQAGPTWRFFSFDPKTDEETPNYEGYGIELATGYSIDRKVDVAFLAQYTPGNLGASRFAKEDASFVLLGGGLGATLWRQGYVGLYGGTGYYNGVNHSGGENTVKGNFNGPAVGLTVGGVLGQAKGTDEAVVRLQVYTERAWVSGRQTAEAEIEKREINTFGVGLVWAYNGFGKQSWEGGVFGGYFD